jgi:hypothetical protein
MKVQKQSHSERFCTGEGSKSHKEGFMFLEEAIGFQKEVGKMKML